MLGHTIASIGLNKFEVKTIMYSFRYDFLPLPFVPGYSFLACNVDRTASFLCLRRRWWRTTTMRRRYALHLPPSFLVTLRRSHLPVLALLADSHVCTRQS